MIPEDISALYVAGSTLSITQTREAMEQTVASVNCLLGAFRSRVRVDVETNLEGEPCGLILCHTKTHVTDVIALQVSPKLVRLGKETIYLGYEGGMFVLFNEIIKAICNSKVDVHIAR